MKLISRFPIDNEISEQLLQKQATIDSGTNDHRYWNLSTAERAEIKKKLMLSQGELCCYCECRIEGRNIHIEHFNERHDYPSQVYDYDNMLLSCEGDRNAALPMKASGSYKPARKKRKENTTCGHKKSRSYHNSELDYSLLLNPAKENTQNLFAYIDGIVEPSANCSNPEKQQVHYTVKRLALDSTKLNQRRDLRIKQIQQQLLFNMSSDDRMQYISSLLDTSTQKLTPYYSTVKDNFGFMVK